MDDIADNNKDSIYQIAESKARQNGANDAHVCIFNEDCIDATLADEGLLWTIGSEGGFKLFCNLSFCFFMRYLDFQFPYLCQMFHEKARVASMQS